MCSLVSRASPPTQPTRRTHRHLEHDRRKHAGSARRHLHRSSVPRGRAERNPSIDCAMMPCSPILVYDGPCTLCNRTVQWVFDKDASERILYTSLQSNWAQANVPPSLRTIESVLFFDGTQWHVKSDAVLYLLRELPRPWRSFFELRIIPKALRNMGYNLLAKFRYRLFGTGHCALLPKERVLV